MARYYEEYRCGCLSPVVDRKKRLVGYCPQHGEDARHVHRVSNRAVPGAKVIDLMAALKKALAAPPEEVRE